MPLPAPVNSVTRSSISSSIYPSSINLQQDRLLTRQNRQPKSTKCDLRHIISVMPAILLCQRQDIEVRPYPSREAPNGEFGASGFFERTNRARTPLLIAKLASWPH